MTELLFALFIGIIGAEIHVCLPAFARWMVRRRAARLPSGLREQMEETWLAEVAAYASHIQKVLFALGLFWGMDDLVRAYGEQKISGHAPPEVIHVSDAVVAEVHEAVGIAVGHSTVRGVGTFVNEQFSAGGHIASTAKVFPPSVTSHSCA